MKLSTFATVCVIALVNEFAGAQTVTFFTSRQQWDFALNNDTPEWCVDFTTNTNSDFSQANGPVTVSDTSNVPRFRLKATGPRVDQNLVSATEDAAVLFVESGSIEDPTFVDLELITGISTQVRALGGSIDFGSQQDELVTLKVTTTSGSVFNFPIQNNGFFGFTVQGGSLTNIRFVATNDDTGFGGEIFTLDDVCGSSSLAVVPTPAPVSMPNPGPTPGGNDDNDCFFSFIPLIGNILCAIFNFIF